MNNCMHNSHKTKPEAYHLRFHDNRCNNQTVKNKNKKLRAKT